MSRLSFANLRIRLLLLVLLGVVPALGLMLYTNIELRRLVIADVKAEALKLTRLAASDQEDSIKNTRQLLFALAQLSEVRAVDPVACSDFFTRLLRQYPQYLSLGVVALDGEIICKAHLSGDPVTGPVNLSNQAFFQRILQSRDFAISDYQIDYSSDKAILNFGYPVLDEETNQLQSVVFASLDLAWLNELVTEAQLPAGSTFTVIDRNGTILVHYPEPQLWVGRSVPEAQIVQLILTQQNEGTAETEGIDALPRLFAFAPLYGLPGSRDAYVSIGIPTSVAFANANRDLVRNLAGLGLATALALMAAWFGGHWFILRWVNVLVEATNRLSAGDLSVRTRLPYGQGELSQLALAFDDMAGSLEKQINERTRAEAALSETQRTLSTLLSNLPGMAYRCRNDQARTMEFVSEGCSELTGYAPAEIAHNQAVSYGQLIHPADRMSVWDKIQTAVQQRAPFRLTYRLLTVAGEEKWVWEQGQGVFSPRGDLLALEGFITDATERVLAYQTLEERVADRTRALSALYDVTAVASGSLNLDTILNRSLSQVLTVMRTKTGAIHLFDESKGLLRLAAWQGISPDELGPADTFPPGGDVTSRVFERGESVLIADLAAERQPPLSPAVHDSQPYIGVPIEARGQVLGVLGVIGQAGQQFTTEDVILLDSIADQVGVAVENARLYQQTEQLAVMEERSRLARELHDSVTQSLYSLTLFAEVGRRSAEASDMERVIDYLARLGQVAQQTLKEMRLLVYELRTSALETEGLVGALQQRLDAVEKRTGVEAHLLVDSMVELPVLVEEGLYRIAQEALNNALKHAAASQVTVRINVDPKRAELEVKDNGKGFDPDNVDQAGRLGLVSMRERAEGLGGSLTISSDPGQGTCVSANVPTRRSSSRAILPLDQFFEVSS